MWNHGPLGEKMGQCLGWRDKTANLCLPHAYLRARGLFCYKRCHLTNIDNPIEETDWNWSWRSHELRTLSALLALCEGNLPASGSPHKGPVTRKFDISFNVELNKLLNKHCSCQWFEFPWFIWHHCNVLASLFDSHAQAITLVSDISTCRMKTT